MDIQIHDEFSELIPPLTPEEYKGLEDSIKKEGCRVAIDIWNSTIVDGHNRYAICKEHNIVFKTNTIIFEDENQATVWIINNQLQRRNLNAYQRTVLALKLESALKEEAKKRQSKAGELYGELHPKKELVHNSAQAPTKPKPDKTREAVAKVAGISHGTVDKVKKIQEKATDEQKENLKTGKDSVNKVHNDIVKEERVEKRKQRDLDFTATPLPTGVYEVILADPPWKYDFSETVAREIENQYPTMELDDIKNIKIPVGDNGVLFLWATAPKLIEALEVMKSWGFKYKTNAIWDKQSIGMGYWFRGQHELLLVGTKGKFSPPDKENRISSVISEKRTKHSKKPNKIYDILESMFPNSKKIELFARQKYNDNWVVWGNETK